MRPYSVDLRVRVLADVDAGMTFAAAGRKYTVSAEWVRQIVRRRDQTGGGAPRPPIPRRVPFHRRHEAELRAATTAHPGQTLDALRRRLGLPVSVGTLWAALRALKITFKNNARGRRTAAAGRGRQAAGVP